MFMPQTNFSYLKGSPDILELGKIKKRNYQTAEPFSHIVLDDFFDEKILNIILNDFPNNLDKVGINFNNVAEKKITLNDVNLLSQNTNNFINFLNSHFFLKFLQILTGIKETLIPDPYLIGGGLHELKENGYLNIHSDFNLHPTMKLDRRLNILIYLNKNWQDNYGGHLELWNREMTHCVKKISPIFNRTVIFSTNDYSFHGNPEKVKCPNHLSRKSIAMYYYSNGRPVDEKKLGFHSTIYRKRPNSIDFDGKFEFKKIFGKFYYKKKNKLK